MATTIRRIIRTIKMNTFAILFKIWFVSFKDAGILASSSERI
ncbi:hypothetical protein [Geoglobus acetivorans]